MSGEWNKPTRDGDTAGPATPLTMSRYVPVEYVDGSPGVVLELKKGPESEEVFRVYYSDFEQAEAVLRELAVAMVRVWGRDIDVNYRGVPKGPTH